MKWQRFFIFSTLGFLLFAGCNTNKVNTDKEKIPVVEKGSFTDSRDGHVYKTIKVNGQVWFAENLDYKLDKSSYYDNDSVRFSKFGRFYSYENAKKACPKGWHIPDTNEWLELVNNFGGKKTAGGSFKALSDWKKSNSTATNSSGFSILPSGYYDIKMDQFFLTGENATFWCLQGKDSSDQKYLSIYYDDPSVIIIKPYKSYCLSVRCLKD